MPIRNITLAISPAAHLKARLWAAHHDVSLSALVTTFLEGLPDNPVAPRVAERIHQQRESSRKPPPPAHASPCETVKPVNGSG